MNAKLINQLDLYYFRAAFICFRRTFKRYKPARNAFDFYSMYCNGGEL